MKVSTLESKVNNDTFFFIEDNIFTSIGRIFPCGPHHNVSISVRVVLSAVR